jgi:hypothetical protein
MNQIYVVINQPNYLSLNMQTGVPVAAFNDFPSALSYAQGIFKPQFGMDQSAKDLIFLIDIVTTAPTGAATVTIPATTATK